MRGASFTSLKQLSREHIDAFIESYNHNSPPFVWTKAEVHRRRVKGRRIGKLWFRVLAMDVREASCACGALKLTCQGEPVRVSMCHCLDCQRRTGSVFGAQARFGTAQVRIEGEVKEFVRIADSGNKVVFRFCPKCGSTVYWDSEGFPGVILVAVGAFGDANFPSPRIAVYETRAHEWAKAPMLTIERRNKV